MYIYVYVYIYMCVYICIHIYIHTHLPMNNMAATEDALCLLYEDSQYLPPTSISNHSGPSV